MKIDLKIGDLVTEFDIDYPNKKFPLGVVVPFPRSFLLVTIVSNPVSYAAAALAGMKCLGY